MKKFIFILVLSLIYSNISTLCQSVSDIFVTNEMLSDPKQKIVYFALPNRIIIHGLENVRGCKVVFSQYGLIEKIDYQTFTIFPINWEKAVLLTIRDTISDNVIFKDSLITLSYPVPIATVNGRRKGKITKLELQKLENMDVFVDQSLWKEKVYVIVGFMISSTNDNLKFESKSQYITTEQKNYLFKLPTKTKIYFDNIRSIQVNTNYFRDLNVVFLEIE